MLRKICPCLNWISSDSAKQRRGYNPEQELQEQQFIHHIEAEGKRYEDSNKLMDDDVTPIQQRLNHQLGLSNPAKTTRQQKNNDHIQNYFSETVVPKVTPQQPNYEEKEEQDLIQLQKKEGDQPEEEEKGYGELLINLPEYDQNYNLLKQSAFNAQELLNTATQCTEIPVTSLNPKGASKKLTFNKTKLRAWRKADSPTSFIIEYVLPCSFSFYSQLVNKKVLPKQNNKFIKQYRLVESLHPNLTAKYICFNKIGMLQSRDFTYLKYTNNSQVSETGHWQLCISKDIQKNDNSAKTGRIHSITYIKQGKVNEEVNVKVKSYINVDIGTNLQKIWEKIFIEVKGYIDQLWEDATDNYEEELV